MTNSEHSVLLREVALELEEIRGVSNRKSISLHKRSLKSFKVENERSFRSSSPNLGSQTKDLCGTDYQYTGKYSGICLEKNADQKSTSISSRMKMKSKNENMISSKGQIISNVINGSDVSDHKFPPGCLKLLYSLPGNDTCIECGKQRPEWASVSYGILLCLHCCGYHRGLGVQVSFVRSIFMDTWSHAQILSMLEGGNNQLANFFHRHSLSPKPQSDAGSNDSANSNCMSLYEKRYKTKAAQFYREHLSKHVQTIISSGEYKGRDAARKKDSTKKRDGKKSNSKRKKNSKSDQKNENGNDRSVR